MIRAIMDVTDTTIGIDDKENNGESGLVTSL